MREIQYNVDIAKQNYEYKACMQGDDLKVILNVYNNSSKYSLTGATVKMNFAKPDGTPSTSKNATVKDNTITCTLDNSYTDVNGKATIEFEITQNGTMTTFPVELVIIKKVFQTEKVNNKIIEVLETIRMDDAVYELLDKVKYSLAELKEEFENVVANVTSGTESVTNSEIVASRSGLTSLGTRLDKIENGERMLKSSIDFLHLKNSIKDIFDTRVILNTFKIEKGFLKSDGTINKNEASTYAMKYYDVSGLDYAIIKGTAFKSTSVYALMNESEEIYEFKPFVTTEVAETTIDVRKAKYIIINSQDNVGMAVYKYESISEIKEDYKAKLEELANTIKEELNELKGKTKDIEETLKAEKTEKGFLKSDGTISKNESSTYTLNYYNVENMSKIILKGTILKSSAYGFIDTNENVLDYEAVSENTEINKALNIPEGAKYLLATTQTISGLTLEAYKNISVSESVNNLKADIEKIKSKIKSNYWEGKTIWLCGTSVPRGDGNKNTYPYLLGQLLNCTVINEAVGGSAICCKEKTSSNWHNMPNDFSTAYRCFSNTLEEQEWVIEQMATGGIYEGKNMDADTIRGMSYEKKLIPYLDGTYPCPDLFIIEHGPNDLRSLDKEVYDGNSPYDLTNYYGTMNFIIKTIFEYQPQARIMLMGHYENQSPKRVITEGQDDYGARTIAARGIVPTKQQKIAEIWNIPIYRTWEYMGWSQMKIKTKGKWVNGYWQENYYEEPVEMTMLAYNLPDQSHPHSDKSGKANLKIAESLAEFLESNIR